MWAAEQSGLLGHITSQEFWLQVNAPWLWCRGHSKAGSLRQSRSLSPSLGQVRLEPFIAREEFSPQGGTLSPQI